MVMRLPAIWKARAGTLGWEDPLTKEMATHSNTLAWKFHGRRRLVGYSPWGFKELDMTEQLHFFTSLFLLNHLKSSFRYQDPSVVKQASSKNKVILASSVLLLHLTM